MGNIGHSILKHPQVKNRIIRRDKSLCMKTFMMVDELLLSRCVHFRIKLQPQNEIITKNKIFILCFSFSKLNCVGSNNTTLKFPAGVLSLFCCISGQFFLKAQGVIIIPQGTRLFGCHVLIY